MLLVLDFTRVKGVIKLEHLASFINATRDLFTFNSFEADVSYRLGVVLAFGVFRILAANS
jgi:hypothetical protein